MTVTFNGHSETKWDYAEAVAALADTASWWIGNKEPILLTFGRLGVFDPPGCWHVTVKSKDNSLHTFRSVLTYELTRRKVYWSDDFEYIPHVTLAYKEKPKENPLFGVQMKVEKFAVVSDYWGITEIMVA